MRIGIVGWGVEGQSAYRYFGPEHEYLIVNEEPQADLPPQSDRIKVQFLNTPRQPGLTGNVTDLSYFEGIEKCDKIIYSVTAAKNLERKFGNEPTFWNKAVTVQHIFFEKVETKNIIGVTGSKGKGTTSTLIAKMLEAEGEKVFLGGNIGLSVLDFIKEVEEDDWVILELSNFQLYKFPYSPHIAVCLMIVPEHMDWHPDMDDYIEAKSNLFKHQKLSDIAIYFAGSDYSKRIANGSPGRKIAYFAPPGARLRQDGMIIVGEDGTEVIPKKEIKLLGEHNLQNICAATTVVFEALGGLDKSKAVLSSFSGLEHRLELVRESRGIKYYDDSFATTPETTIVAMQAIPEPKIMILGGHDKGIPFDSLAQAVASSNVRHVITIGKVGPKIAELLRKRGFDSITEGLTDMKSIIKLASGKARPGDAVLLSCGTSSFGIFKDYKDRGNQFKAAVNNL